MPSVQMPCVSAVRSAEELPGRRGMDRQMPFSGCGSLKMQEKERSRQDEPYGQCKKKVSGI